MTINCLGDKLATCLHNSEPMEPPPPEIKTDSSSIPRRIFCQSNTMGSRPNKSSKETSRKASTLTLPLAKSFKLGNVLKGIAVFSQQLTTCRICVEEMEGKAIIM